jgi:hypothetical protein
MTRRSKVWVLSMIGLAAAAVPSLFAALTLTTSTNSVAIPFATTDYNKTTGVAQIIKTSANTLTIRSTSGAWTLSVRALAATFSFAPSAGDPNPNKPAGDLAVRAPATSSTWLVLTTTNQVLSTGPQATGNQTRELDYRLNSNLNSNPPGTYTLSVIYTLTSP